MKRKLTALLLAFLLAFSALPVLAEEDKSEGEYMYDYVVAVADFIRTHGLYSYPDDDPLQNALIAMLEENPELLDLLLGYMLSGYDERTMYIPAEYMQARLQTTDYVGVGMTLLAASETYLEVSDLHPDGGAKRAGIEVGDHLLAVDGNPIEELNSIGTALLLRDGEPGSFVDVTIRRGDAVYELTLERAFLGEPEYSAHELEPGIWLMRWTQFLEYDLMENFYATIAEMQETDAKSLIIDLRGNSGGLLDMAYEIVNTLIPEEGVHYLTVSMRDGVEIVPEKIYSPGGGVELENIIVLCDSGTASASEIIMTALCGTGHAVAVGERTYGKGTAQYEIDTPTGALMVITAFKILSPNGSDYNLTGMEPFYTVANAEIAVTPPAFRLREAALSFGSCSDDSVRLNKALVALGMMREPRLSYRLGEDTQVAINNLRQISGLEKISGIDIETIALINAALDNLKDSTVIVDTQMEKALELAR